MKNRELVFCAIADSVKSYFTSNRFCSSSPFPFKMYFMVEITSNLIIALSMLLNYLVFKQIIFEKKTIREQVVSTNGIGKFMQKHW